MQIALKKRAGAPLRHPKMLDIFPNE